MIDNLPSDWEIKELNEVSNFINGFAFKSSQFQDTGIPIVRIGNLVDEVIDLSDKVSYKEDRKLEPYLIQKNDILIAMSGATTGKIAYNKRNDKLYLNQRIGLLRVKEQVLSKYLFNFLKGKKNYLLSLSGGSAQPNLSLNDIKQVLIPIPPLQQQKKIVKVLDLTSNLIEKQKELLEKYDLFLKSKFIEMFGDPISNSMGWEVVKLGDYGTLARGKSAHRPRNAPFLYGGDYPFIQTGDITKKGSIYIKDFKQTYSEEGIKQSKLFPKNTIAITIAANIGDVKILSFDCYFPDSVVGFNVKTPLFIVYLLSFYKDKLEQQSTQTAQKNINLQVLNNLDVIKPKIELQNKFALIVEKIETIKEKENQKLKQFEDLHNFMMNKAFKGDIN